VLLATLNRLLILTAYVANREGEPGLSAAKRVRNRGARFGALCVIAFPILLVCAACVFLILEYQQDQRDRALISAIEGLEVHGALRLLKSGASPNAVKSDRSVPDFRALLNQVKNRLLRIPLPRSPSGVSALLLAAEKDEIQVEDALLARGANDFRGREDGDDSTTLIGIALDNHHPELARRLWEKGAADRDDCAGLLVSAVYHNDRTFVATLLDRGVNVNRPYERVSPFFAAADVANWPMMQLLIDHGASVNGEGRDAASFPSSALLEAANKNDGRLAAFLLDHRSDVDFENKWGSPLTRAVEHRNLPMVRLLLAHSANPNPGYNSQVFSSLYDSVNKEILKLLVRARPNPNRKDRGYGWDSPLLIFLAAEGNIEGVRIALDAGIDVNIRNRYGTTPLMVAARDGQIGCIRLLLRRGADVNARNYIDQDAADPSGDTALDIAIREPHPKCVRLLRSSGGRRSSELSPPGK
jgi:hypothetical protein